MSEREPSPRADLKSGTLYAVFGEAGWIYYGQVTPNKRVGFFRRRDRDMASAADILSAPVMAVISINLPSIKRALRSRTWSKLGRFELACTLEKPWPMVWWSVGTLTVSVLEGVTEYDTRVEDPAIQNMERASVLDAEHHIPARLTADFGEEEGDWNVGGPIWRERRISEERARRFPDDPWCQLPPDWVWTNVS